MGLIRKIYRIDATYRNVRRYLEIIDKLLAFGFGDLVISLRLSQFRRFWGKCTRKPVDCHTRPRPERVRLLLEALGPTFVKLGQVLSTRPDLIPYEYIREFSRLQDQVPGFPYEAVEKIIRAELGHPVEELFQSFEREPFAAASIGQVHRAVTRAGEEVVVKVQRPDTQRRVEVDLEILYYLAGRVEQFEHDLKVLQPVRIVEEFSYVLRREIDYRVEAAHTREFAADMAAYPAVQVPRIYDDLSSRRVLTMELIKGDLAGKLLKDPALQAKYDLPLLAEEGARAVFAQIFEYGFFHADPHPGNLFALPGNRIAFIDFGMMGRVSERERLLFIRVLNYILTGNIERVTATVMLLTTTPDRRPPERLERELGDLIQENLHLPMKKLSLATILESLMRIMSSHQISMTANLYVMFKALASMESLAKQLSPELKLLDLLKPFLRDLKLRSFHPRKYLSRLYDASGGWFETLLEAPPVLNKILYKLEQGKLRIEFEHRGITPVLAELESIAFKIAGSIVIAALITGSSLIILARVPPLWHQVSLLGLIGFSVSGVLGLMLLLSIWYTQVRKRRQ